MAKIWFKVENVGIIADINYRDDLIMCQSDIDNKAIRDSLPLKVWDYFKDCINDIRSYSFFVKVENGEYKEIYAYDGNIPYINKWIYKIEWGFTE